MKISRGLCSNSPEGDRYFITSVALAIAHEEEPVHDTTSLTAETEQKGDVEYEVLMKWNKLIKLKDYRFPVPIQVYGFTRHTKL